MNNLSPEMQVAIMFGASFFGATSGALLRTYLDHRLREKREQRRNGTT